MKTKNTLLILSQEARRYAELIRQLDLPDLELTACETPEEARQYIEQCHIILAEPARIAPILGSAKRLEWVQSMYAGVETLMFPALRTDYVLTGVKGFFGPLMSEYVFGYILALERHLLETYQNQQDKIWQKIPYKSLQGKLFGICGLGSIGRHLARTARHFGMRVWGYKRSYELVPEVERVFTKVNFHEFLAHLDYLVITLPFTPETIHLIDKAAFHVMKNSAILINVGRGSVVSESALIRALENRLIRGAILDVFEEEPLSKENPLWRFPNVWITPHTSALTVPEEVVTIFAENYRRFVSGEPLHYQIDFRKGY